VPPTSLKAWEQYLSDSAFAKRPLIQYYSKVTVDKVSAGGFDYGELRFEFGEPVSATDRRRMFVLRREYEATVRQTTAAAAADDVAGVDEHGQVVDAEVVDDGEEVPPASRPFGDEPPF